MKKRIGCVLLASIMLLLGMTVFIGAESPTLALEAVEVSGEAGDTVTLAVCLTGNPGLTSLIVMTIPFRCATRHKRDMKSGTSRSIQNFVLKYYLGKQTHYTAREGE